MLFLLFQIFLSIFIFNFYFLSEIKRGEYVFKRDKSDEKSGKVYRWWVVIKRQLSKILWLAHLLFSKS